MLVRKVKQEEIETIHEKTLFLLENVGIRFDSPELIEVFKKHGIRTQGAVAYFSEKDVEQPFPSFSLPLRSVLHTEA